jgi:hypothetical protein
MEPNENEKHSGAPPTTGFKIFEKEPLAPVLQYHHAALGVSDFAASRAFYAKLGFTSTADNDKILAHPNGMSLHLFQAKPVAENHQNILMDVSNRRTKPPSLLSALEAVLRLCAARQNHLLVIFLLEKWNGSRFTSVLCHHGDY